MVEPFFQDLKHHESGESNIGLSTDPVWRTLLRSGVDRDKLHHLYTATTMSRLIRHRMNKQDIRAQSVIFAANTTSAAMTRSGDGSEEDGIASYKVGFDRRADVDIFFLGTRNLLMIDYDDRNEWKLTRKDFLNLLQAIAEEGYTFALHETDRGLHAFCVSHLLSIDNSEVYRLMRCAGCDPFYILFSLSQGWRIRIAPKASSLEDRVAWSLDTFPGPGSYNKSLKTWVIGTAPILREQGQLVLLLLDLVNTLTKLYVELKVTPTWFNTVASDKALLQRLTELIQMTIAERGCTITPALYPYGMLILQAERPSEPILLPTAKTMPPPLRHDNIPVLIPGDVKTLTMTRLLKELPPFEPIKFTSI